ncbi:MAG: trypco2 family protein [Pseudonocardia sp.]
MSVKFSGELKTVRGGGGGVKFWVLSADANAERTTGAGQR